MLRRFMVCALLLAAITGCGGSGGDGGSSDTTPPTDTTSPSVSSTNPSNGATNVAVNAAITATFTEAMDASTITVSTFTLKDSGNTSVSGTVSYTGTTATFTPKANLSSNTAYTATVTTGAKDAAGNAMATDYEWGFTASDTIATSGDWDEMIWDQDIWG